VIKQKHLHQFQFLAENFDAMMEKFNPEALLRSINEKDAVKYFKKQSKSPDSLPTMSVFNASRNLGACSEAFLNKVNEVSSHAQSHTKLSAYSFIL
jgi:DNA-directed RNA polymerase I subunit RPA1